MPSLTFLSPLFLAGLVAVAIPVLIHLIYRRKAHVIPFSTLRFLRLSQTRVARRQRLRELLLLLMRCAILALLAFAFAGPVLHQAGNGAGGPVHAVLVLDDSFSMAYRHGEKTSFGLAKESAAALVESLPPGSEAALLFCGANHGLEFPELTPGLMEIATAIRNASAGAHANTLTPFIERGARLLADSSWPAREFYVWTDQQARAWEGIENSEAAALLTGDAVPVTVVDCGVEKPRNLAIAAAQVRPSPEDGPDALRFEVTVKNQGSEDENAVVMLFREAGGTEPAAEQEVQVEAGGALRTVLRLASFDDVFAGEVRLQADALAADNSRFVRHTRQDRTRLLLVGRKAREPNGRFFVEAALSVGAGVEVFAVEPEALATMRLDEYDAVVAAQPEGLDSGGAQALGDYVRAGGGLVIFPGPSFPADSFNALFGETAGLPVRLRPVRRIADGDSVHWDAVETEHALFAPFKGERAKDLAFIRATAYYPLEKAGKSASGLGVLVRYSDKQPALVEARAGAGRALVFTAPCGGDWCNLPLRASFVPLMHQVAAYFSEREHAGEPDHRVGEPLEFEFPAAAGRIPVQVTTPDGSRHLVLSESVDDRNVATFRGVDRPGFYEVEFDSGPDAPSPVFAVNIDPAESDVSRVQTVRLNRAFPLGTMLASGEAITRAEGGVQKSAGAQLAWALLIFLVLAGAVESVLAALFSSRRGKSEGVRARSRELGASVGAVGHRETGSYQERAS